MFDEGRGRRGVGLQGLANESAGCPWSKQYLEDTYTKKMLTLFLQKGVPDSEIQI